MTLSETMNALRKAGTAQNIKIYKRHGAGDKLFGVSFGELNKIRKKIKGDHELALQLWETGNMDAQTLATMIADPEQMSLKTANAWVKEVQYYLLADLVADLIAKSPHAESRMTLWMKSMKEHLRQCGYSLLACRLRNGDEFTDSEASSILQTIESEIHGSPNRARHSMNNALTAIGIYMPSLTKLAKETAGRIGKVEVDHGETSCTTPDAIQYIDKALKRNIRRKRC